MKRRIKLTIAYDGTNYRGWQIQNPTSEHPEGSIPTIQGELTLAIQRLTKDCECQLIGASRTDSGVHAYGNVAVFDTCTNIPVENFPSAINSFLSEDIRIMRAEEVAAEFNPRFVPHKKTYEYKVDNSPIASPMNRLYTYNFTYRLDIGRMQKAAKYLVGEHDFTSFVNPDSQVFEHGGDAVREIYSIDIFSSKSEYSNHEINNRNNEYQNAISLHTVSDKKNDNNTASKKVNEKDAQQLTIRISGNGFLYHMIRIIVGTLLQVGNGKRDPEEMKDILNARNRIKAGPTVPAKGLCLVELKY